MSMAKYINKLSTSTNIIILPLYNLNVLKRYIVIELESNFWRKPSTIDFYVNLITNITLTPNKHLENLRLLLYRRIRVKFIHYILRNSQSKSEARKQSQSRNRLKLENLDSIQLQSGVQLNYLVFPLFTRMNVNTH